MAEKTYRILILGASYGSLLGAKLILAGHDVTMICLPEEVDLINGEGIRVKIPVRGRDGRVAAAGPEARHGLLPALHPVADAEIPPVPGPARDARAAQGGPEDRPGAGRLRLACYLRTLPS